MRWIALVLIFGLSVPARGAEVRIVDLERLWEVGADEDDAVIFGVISSLDVDAEGNVFVLDRQLTEVHMFSRDGEYVGPVGREGEGPGEYSRIGHVFVSGPGEIGVVQRMPGKIVAVRTDGTPGETIPLPEVFSSAPAYFFAARRAGDGLVLLARQLRRAENGVSMTDALVRIDAAGNEVARFAESFTERDRMSDTISETATVPVLWAVDEAGSVYLNDDFDAYELHVYDPAGVRVRTITRDYEHRRRSDREMELNTPRMTIRRGRGGPARELKGIPSPTDRDIQALFARPDGTLWVLSSHGAFDVPDSILATFDVFDAGGEFVRQVALRGEGSFREDGLHIVGDRLYVTRGFQAALRADRGIGDESDEDAEPMSVVCYRLGPGGTAVGGSN